MCSWAHEPCVFKASLLFSRRPPLTHDERRTTFLSLPVSRAGSRHFSWGPAAGTTLFARLLRIARGSAEKLWPSSFINKQTNKSQKRMKKKKHSNSVITYQRVDDKSKCVMLQSRLPRVVFSVSFACAQDWWCWRTSNLSASSRCTLPTITTTTTVLRCFISLQFWLQTGIV
jgi:hypothetical protein